MRGMEAKLHHPREARLALFVGGPADGLLRMVTVDEVGLPVSHV
jgi:hypothetical protein